jgi:hypothetical protein
MKAAEKRTTSDGETALWLSPSRWEKRPGVEVVGNVRAEAESDLAFVGTLKSQKSGGTIHHHFAAAILSAASFSSLRTDLAASSD